MSRFINTELKLDSQPSGLDLDDNELMTKLEKSGSDSEWSILLKKNSYLDE